MLNIKQAATTLGISIGAVLQAIKIKRLNACKNERKWSISVEELDKYRNSLYKRDRSMIDGELVYDKAKGEFSVPECAKIISCPEQTIYHACRRNLINSTKKKCHWVIKVHDLIEFKKKYAQRNEERLVKQKDINVLGNKCYSERQRKKANKEVSMLRRI